MKGPRGLRAGRRVHSANKLAQRHERVALTLQPEGSQCDICQEEKAIMFCSEDRALICRRCGFESAARLCPHIRTCLRRCTDFRRLITPSA